MARQRPLFEHLRHLPGALRLTYLAAYVRSLGIAPARTFSPTFQETPMRHRGADVGHFFLAEKADGEEFTGDDEEVLTVFASQAAAAITNARTHRSERRARADLEALVETSPVGVVVMDARTGRPVSFNREARRIVESLRTPGYPAEQLLEVISVRRADGREVSLAEIPLARTLGTGETVRADEVVPRSRMGAASGRASTPLPSGPRATRSARVVVTMQDLAPLDEIERTRTEFLGLVSHELRAPLLAIKGSADAALEEGAELDLAEMVRDLLDAGLFGVNYSSRSPSRSSSETLPSTTRSGA